MWTKQKLLKCLSHTRPGKNCLRGKRVMWVVIVIIYKTKTIQKKDRLLEL